MSQDNPHPLPVAHKVVIPPTTDVPQQPALDCHGGYAGEVPPQIPPPEATGSNSLDTQESSVRKDFDAWMHQKGTPEDFFSSPVLDITSNSARFRHSGWQKFRQNIWKSMERTSQSPARRRAFGECGSYSWIEQHESKQGRFRLRYNHCHDRLCTPCANARSIRIQDALLAQIDGQAVSFITLTLCGKKEPLTDLVDRLYKHFRALRLHPFWAEKVRGGAAFLEIKYSDKARRWHPHLHIIADADFLPQGELSNVWRGITKDSYIVDVRRVKEPKTTAHYVTKYASKPLNTSFMNSPDLLDEALRALKGRRLCLCFGTWYGTSLTDAEDETLEEDAEAGNWHMFADLESIITRVNAGDKDALTVLILAGGESRWRSMLENSS